MILAAVFLLVVLCVVVVLAVRGRREVAAGERRRSHDVHQLFLDELFESADEAAALVDAEGRLVRANDAFHHLFGTAPAEVGQLWLDTLLGPVGDGSPLAEIVYEVVGTDQPRNVDAVARRREGAAVEVSVRLGPVRLPDHPAAAWLLVRDDGRKALVDAAFRRLESALDTMQLGVTVSDLEGRIVYTNPADAAMHGWEPEELIGRHVRVLGTDHTAERLAPEEIARLERWRRETVNERRDGTPFPVQLLSDVVRDVSGRPIGVVTTCEDITQRKRAEQALRESEERYAVAMRGANDGLWDWNVETGEMFYSSRCRELLGIDPGSPADDLEAWLDRVHPEDRESLEIALAAQRTGAHGARRFEHEHRISADDGGWRWVLARGMAERGPDDRPYRIAGALTDTTARKTQERQLEQDALYDALTGLPNRAYLRDLLGRMVGRAERRADFRFAVLFVDLDRFKEVNDALGHAAGDALLVEVARRLESCVRPGDVAVRLGGDEFCVVLDDIRGQQDATRVARRILDSLKAPVQAERHSILTSGSIGIALSETSTEDPEEVLRNADAAMYRAKAAGRGGFELFDRVMQEQALTLLRTETELRRALSGGEFRLLYQPVVRLEDRSVIGLEALVRWQHPERGVLSPAEFVPLAEETGVIVPLGWWILDEACRRMGAWLRAYPSMNGMSVSVNLSARQLRQPDLLERIERSLKRGGLPPERLRVEVSERVLMDDAEWNQDILGRLRRLGVQVQVDDFGTGTSSLSFLGRFGVSTMKIDRSLVQGMHHPAERAAVVQALITLARQLDIRVVAEGVETADDHARLRDLECEQGQGYLFHHPLEPEDVARLFQREAARA